VGKFVRLAVIFPGIGYHTDKPLLYYSKKIAREYDFEIVSVDYCGFDSSIKGNAQKMKEAFHSALSQTEEILKGISFDKYETILFISKSVGTAVAGAYANKHGIDAYNLFYTPVEQSFETMNRPGLVFHGNNDPWMNHERFMECIEKTNYPYHIIDEGNHSLETGDVIKDIENMKYVMSVTKEYICAL